MIRGNYIIFLEKYSKYLNVVHVQPHRGMKKVILRFEQMYPDVCSVCFVNHFSDNDINILHEQRALVVQWIELRTSKPLI